MDFLDKDEVPISIVYIGEDEITPASTIKLAGDIRAGDIIFNPRTSECILYTGSIYFRDYMKRAGEFRKVKGFWRGACHFLLNGTIYTYSPPLLIKKDLLFILPREIEEGSGFKD